MFLLKRLRYLIWLAIFFLLASLVIFSCYLFFNEPSLQSFLEKHELTSKSSSDISSNKKVVGKALFLRPFTVSYLFTDLRSSIEIFIHRMRPDVKMKRRVYTMVLKQGGEKRKVEEKEKVYFQINRDGGTFSFSKDPTSFWIFLSHVDKQKVAINVGVDLKERGLKNITSSFTIKASVWASQEGGIKDIKCFRELATSKWWRPSQLFSVFHNRRLEKKQRLMIESSPASYICPVESGDMLIWKELKWEVARGDTQGYPLAYIKSIDAKVMKIEGWDIEGRKKYKFAILPHATPSLLGSVETLISNVHLRTTRQISCQIGKRRMILKEGDWVVKKRGRWELVQSMQNLGELQNNPEIEEFFFFERISQKGSSKILEGYRFSQMMSYKLEVQIPISLCKQQNIKRNR